MHLRSLQIPLRRSSSLIPCAPTSTPFDKQYGTIARFSTASRVSVKNNPLSRTQEQRDISSYNFDIRRQIREGNYDAAERMFSEVPRLGLKPDISTYNMMLWSGKLQRDISRVVRRKNDIITSGIPLNTFSYNHILGAFASVNDMYGMDQEFQEMKSKGIAPNSATYNTVLGGYAKLGDFRKMIEILDKMRGDKILPNESTMQIVVSAFATKGDIPKMLYWFEKFREWNVRPEEETTAAVVDAFARSGDVSQMITYFNKLKELGIPPGKSMYNAVIHGYRNTSDLENAFKTFDDMVEKKIEPDKTTFRHLFSLAGLVNRPDLISKLSNVMTHTYMVPLDGSLAHTIINSYARCNDFKNILNFLNEMKKSNVPPNYDVARLLVRKVLQLNITTEYSSQRLAKILEAFDRPPKFVSLSSTDLEELMKIVKSASDVSSLSDGSTSNVDLSENQNNTK